MTTPQLPDPIRSVSAESGTLDAVLATARRRRARRLQAVGGTSAVLVLVGALAVSIGGGDGSQSLGITDDGMARPTVADGAAPESTTPEPAGPTSSSGPEPDSVVIPPPLPTLLASPSPRPSAASPRPSATATPRPMPAPHHSRTPQPAPSRTTTPAPRPTRPAPEPSREPSPAARGEMRRTHATGVGGTFCERGVSWCGSGRVVGSGPVDLSLDICRSEDAGPATLSVSASPTDFAVSQGGRELWRWSSGQAFPAVQSTMEFGAGDCYEWATTWRGVDDTNRPLPAGRYAVEATFRSEEFSPTYNLTVDLG